jgi:hypothetical protein
MQILVNLHWIDVNIHKILQILVNLHGISVDPHWYTFI